MLELYSPFVLNGGSALTFCIMPYGFTLQKPSNGRSLGGRPKRFLLRFERINRLHFASKTLAYTMIHLRHFWPP